MTGREPHCIQHDEFGFALKVYTASPPFGMLPPITKIYAPVQGGRDVSIMYTLLHPIVKAFPGGEMSANLYIEISRSPTTVPSAIAEIDFDSELRRTRRFSQTVVRATGAEKHGGWDALSAYCLFFGQHCEDVFDEMKRNIDTSWLEQRFTSQRNVQSYIPENRAVYLIRTVPGITYELRATRADIIVSL